MPANTDPIYSKNGQFNFVRITSNSQSSAGNGTIGTDIFKAFTADATNGSFVRYVQFSPTSTVQNTATTATVGRVFVSSITTGTTTSTDTWLVAEITLPSVTAASSSSASTMYSVPLNLALKAGYTILVTNHAAPAANTAWAAGVIAGDY